ncbi:MAG: translation initiation factor [Bacteroidota bacterium]
MENDWKKRLGMVYSTDPDYKFDAEQDAQEETPAAHEQKLYVSLDRKRRKGKAVTLVEGFRGSSDELKALGKELKVKCGAGGAVKDGEIIIQGDFRERVTGLLKEKGYSVKQKGG